MFEGLTNFAVFYLVATAVGAVTAFGLAVAAWRRRSQPAALQFALLNLDVAGWCATAVLVRLDVPYLFFVWNLNNVFIFALIFVWFAFVLAYTGRSSWLRSKPALALWSVPAVVAVASFVPPARNTLVVPESPATVAGLTIIPSSFTELGAALLVFVFALDLFAFGLLGEFFVRSRSPYRKQIGAVIGARLFGFVTAVTFYAGALSDTDLNLVPAAYAVQGLVIGWALFRYDLLDVAPLAADTIVEQMVDSVVVLDTDDRIVDFNPALARLVAADGDLTGRHVGAVIPGLPDAIRTGGFVRITPESTPLEGPQSRIYDPQSTELYDHHDVYRGQVVVLRDVTLQRTRERTLEALQSATQEFLDATDRKAVADIAVRTAEEALSCPYSGVTLYDEDSEELLPVALADELSAALREEGLLQRGADAGGRDEGLDRDGYLERTFESGDSTVCDPLVLQFEGASLTISKALLLPLGEHGVLGIGKREGDTAFSVDERRTARTLARSTETALDRLKREQELAESRRAVEHRTEQLQFFNSALRHDLRNAITIIDANLEFLADHVEAAGRSHLETVSTWVDDMTGLVETVASVTDTITGEDDRELTPVPVSEELEARIDKVASGHESLTVTASIPPGLRATGDELFGEVVENLLLNAVEHNDTDSPEITVTAEDRGDAVEVRIADNGPGIPEDFRGDVFDPGVTSDDSGSIGFGLYFVKVMVEAYGGTVHFEANDPRGTVAVLSLPAPAVALEGESPGGE